MHYNHYNRSLTHSLNHSLTKPFVGTSKRVAKKKSRKGIPVFARTSRINGLERWINELLTLKSLDSDETVPGIAMIIELAKELLYSGVPEQVVELYAAYYDLILKDNDPQV